MKMVKRRTEYATVLEGVIERVFVRVMERVLDRAMSRWIRQMKERETNGLMKRVRLIGRTQGAPADRNVNPRTPFDHLIKKSEEVELQLMFANKLHHTFFTKDTIRDENGECVEIKLIDSISRETVEMDPLSSIVIEIVVLDGDFGYEGNENWTEQEFNAKIVCEREGQGPLVKGKQNITLKNGVGTIQDLSIFDNSSWIKCRKFRLGARVLQSTSNMGQVRIKEAVSEAFAVMDYRTRDYPVKRSKKRDLPSLDNDVSPLKKIKKNAECHTDNNIHTVRDFKQMHRTDLNKQIEEDEEKLNAVQVVHQGLAGMQNDCNLASSSQYMSALLQENVPNLTSHLPVISTQSLNNDFVDPTSLFNLIKCSPNNNRLPEQKMTFHNIYFSKYLTKSDITSEIDLPTEMAEHMFLFMNGRHFLDLKAEDRWGKEWPFRYHTRPNGSKICPVFTIGWQRFVEAKCVRVGDELIFSGHQVAGADGELEMRYMIRVTRPGPFTFKGEPVTLDVEYLA